MRKVLLLFVSIFAMQYANAQVNVIQDAEGETSYQMASNSIVTFKSAESAISFSYQPKAFVNNEPDYWAITGSANASEDVASLFKGGKFQFEGKLGGVYMYNFTKSRYARNKYKNKDRDENEKNTDPNLGYFFVGGEFTLSRFNVYDLTLSFDDQVYKKSAPGLRIYSGMNWDYISFGFLGNFTVGFNIAGGVKNNTDVLDVSEITTSTNQIVNGNQTRTISTTDEAYEVTNIDVTQLFGRVNVDIGKHIGKSKRVLANLHVTYGLDENIAPIVNPAFGLFITPQGAPLEAVVGMQLQYRDLFNYRNAGTTNADRSSIILTAGFPF